MQCPLCKSKETKNIQEVDDSGDVERVICAEETCGYIHSQEVITKRADGSELRRSQRVAAEDQPESFQFTGKDGETLKPEDRLLTAQEMTALAIRTREDTLGKAARTLVGEVLKLCAENVLAGTYDYLIGEGETPPGEVFSLAVKELKDRGYKVKKTPKPGEGVCITVTWPTKKRPRKGKQGKHVPVEEEEMTFKTKNSTKEKQAAAARARRKALKARSKSPT